MIKEIDINKDIFEPVTRYLRDWLINSGISESVAKIIADYSGFILVIALALIIFYISKFIIVRWVHHMAVKSSSNWDDAFVQRKVFKRLAYLIPAIIIHAATEFVIPDYPTMMTIVTTVIKL